MVEIKRALSPALESLSVLALSSRFDGRMMRCGQLTRRMTFSTRSVESF